MNYKKYNNKIDIHTIKINKFKYCAIEIVFKNKIEDTNITNMIMLKKFLTYSCKKYPTKRDLSIKLEELYNASLNSFVYTKGKYIYTIISLDFLNPKYCENNYINELIDLLYEIIMKPNINNGIADSRTFTIIKNRTQSDIETQKEIPSFYAKLRSLYHMDKDSISSMSPDGTIEELNKINENNLIDIYNFLLNKSECEIFISGNMDMDNITNIINNKIKLSTNLKVDNKDKIILNKLKNKPTDITEEGNYEQDTLIVIYNTNDLTDRERFFTFNLFNFILGSGGLTSKLYKYVREENSLCYNIYSNFSKYDSLLMIGAGINAKDKDKCLELINKALKEMNEGIYTDEEIDNAKKNITNSLAAAYDSPYRIIANYENYIDDNIPLPEERIKIYNSITRKELLDLSKKIKLNTIYLLKGSDHNEKN